MKSLLEEIEACRLAFRQAIQRVKDRASLEEVRATFLGRKRGKVTALFEAFKNLPVEEKPFIGRELNNLKNELTAALEKKEAELIEVKKDKVERIDLTLPGKKRYLGSPHPITLFLEEIERIFLEMGFSIEEGPEIETDYYNFEALNFPPHHPARDSWDTLYIKNDLLLRTHTSPVQVRVMERQRPPIRIIVPGKVFRREAIDPTHLPMFYQVEGLVVDEGVTFAHLKGTLEYFLKALFGEKTKVRFRPSYFPFTEPSAEVDIECTVCRGNDSSCQVCGGSGWKEVLGAGMVDPQVLKNVNIDPERYSGWAFGLGIERTAMLLYGLNDMRLFYENDLRFLRQFRRK
ncbi:MAG: phenylalanine--tRNA ligase subunit alpha [Candidatus Aminicenantes bacterium]|nr:phenylalanine--tRNA ligase subunit alpha [Candidatus Aminicenantes bacterium]